MNFLFDEDKKKGSYEVETLKESIRRIKHNLDIIYKEIEEIEKSNHKLAIEKTPILTQIENEFLLTYEKLRKSKNKIAVSLIVDNACSMCGNGLPPMEVQKAKSYTDEIFCPVCKRFLYCG